MAGRRPAHLPATGHSWRSWTEETQLHPAQLAALPTGPSGHPTLWSSRLRPWTASSTLDLTDAPGVAEVARAILPGEPDSQVECAQAVRAEYDRDGFRAAAVTSMMVARGAPLFETSEVEHVELDLTGPHAVVAIARGGAWEGVPLVSAWVTGEAGPDDEDDPRDQW